MDLHDVLVHLLAIRELLRANCTVVHLISPSNEMFEQWTRWLAVRIALAEDAAQLTQSRGTTVVIQYVTRSGSRGSRSGGWWW